MPAKSGVPEPPFFALPSVLMAFYSAGTPHLLAGAWAGIICSQPAVLFLTLRRFQDQAVFPPPGDSFSVNVPREDLLSLPVFRAPLVGRDIELLAPFGLVLRPGLVGAAPVIEGCPARIECRRLSMVSRFGQETASGEVLAVHVDDEVYGVDAPFDLCRLKPFRRQVPFPGLSALPEGPFIADQMFRPGNLHSGL